jgi:hypothetical protein
MAGGRQLVGFGWEARRDEPSRQGTLQHADQIKFIDSQALLATGQIIFGIIVIGVIGLTRLPTR